MTTYMATFRPKHKPLEVVCPYQFVITTDTPQEARAKARERVRKAIKAGEVESWHVESLRLKKVKW